MRKLGHLYRSLREIWDTPLSYICPSPIRWLSGRRVSRLGGCLKCCPPSETPGGPSSRDVTPPRPCSLFKAETPSACPHISRSRYRSTAHQSTLTSVRAALSSPSPCCRYIRLPAPHSTGLVADLYLDPDPCCGRCVPLPAPTVPTISADALPPLQV